MLHTDRLYRWARWIEGQSCCWCQLLRIMDEPKISVPLCASSLVCAVRGRADDLVLSVLVSQRDVVWITPSVQNTTAEISVLGGVPRFWAERRFTHNTTTQTTLHLTQTCRVQSTVRLAKFMSHVSDLVSHLQLQIPSPIRK